MRNRENKLEFLDAVEEYLSELGWKLFDKHVEEIA
jgi:hypothetical protein